MSLASTEKELDGMIDHLMSQALPIHQRAVLECRFGPNRMTMARTARFLRQHFTPPPTGGPDWPQTNAVLKMQEKALLRLKRSQFQVMHVGDEYAGRHRTLLKALVAADANN